MKTTRKNNRKPEELNSIRWFLFASEPVAERFSPHLGEHVPEEAVAFAGVDQGEDVGVVELGGEPDLGQKPLPPEHSSQLGPQHLEGHFAIMLEVPREIARGHVTLPQLPPAQLG